MKTPFNRFLYIGFLLLGIFQAFFSNDYMQATTSLGIALAFDPFDQEQKWNERPIWQKSIFNHSSSSSSSYVWFWNWIK
jgi:hypothetical protein